MAKQIKFSKTEYDEYRAKGLSNTQIASKLGMSDGTLYAKLKQWREENAVDSTDTTNNITSNDNKSNNIVDKNEYNILYENRHEVLRYLKLDKLSYQQVANKFNVSYDTVLDFVNKGRRFTAGEIRTMRNRLRNGDTEENIARDYETSPQIVAGIFKTTYTSPDTPSLNNSPITKLLSYVDDIAEAYKVLKSLFEEYNANEAKLATLNKTIQDILHKIEFDEYSDDEASLIVSQLREYRIERRKIKDFNNLFESLADLQASNNIMYHLQRLWMTLKRIKTRAKEMDNRVYTLKGGDNDE